MRKSSLFATTAPIGPGHGGGIVSWNECLALSQVTGLCQVIAPGERGSDASVVTRLDLHQDPFTQDALAAREVRKVEVAFLNGATWNEVVKAARAQYVIVDCPAHNLEASVEEFGRLGLEYPYRHMTDREAFMRYTAFIRDADLILCPSQMSANYLMQNPGTKARVVVIPHGADLPETTSTFPDRFTVGFLGAGGPDKGLAYLYRAWAGLLYTDAELLIAGGGHDVAIPTLARTQRRFLGKVEDTAAFYQSLSVYVQPSVTEGFGLPILEAMAHGRPVVVTSGAGVSELVTDGVDGYVVPVRRPDLIADALDTFKRSPSAIERMGRAARATAERYGWERARTDIREAVSSVIS